MALQDPTDPAGYFDPAIADAFAAQSDPYGFEWPPREWSTDAPDQQIGGAMGVIENAAAPSIAGEEFDQIEMPPENMRPVQIGQPRDPSVANQLGAPTYDEPVAPDLYHEDQFQQTGMDQQVAPRLEDSAPLPPGFAGEIRPERSTADRTLEYLQNPDKLAVEDLAAQQEADRYEQEWGQVARNRNQMGADDNYRRVVEAQNKAAADTEAIKADAARLANTKVDSGRWFKNASTGQKIGSWIAAIVGGLVSGRTGGPNTGLQNILKMIDDDVENQKTDLQNQYQSLGMRRSMIGEEYARSGDMFRASEAYRIASYDREIGNIKERAQQLDPQGTQARAYAKLAMGLESAKQNAIIAMTERNQKFRMGEAELQGKQLANAAAAKKLAGIGMGGAGGVKLTPQQIGAKYGTTEVPPEPMTEKEYGAWLGTRGKVVELGAKIDDATSKARAKRVGAPGEFKNSDGSNFEASSPQEGEKLRITKSAVDLIAEMRNEIARGIARHGGESDYWKSDDWQKQQSRHALTLAAVTKALALGTLDEGSVDMAKKMAGAVDPTSFWRDATPGLNQLVDGMAAKFDNDMRSQEYTGKRYSPPNLGELPDPTSNARDAKYQDLLNFDPQHDFDRQKKAFGGIPMMRDAETGETPRSWDALPKYAESHGVLPDQLEELRRISADATQTADPKKRSAAIDQLTNIAKKAKAPNVKTIAQDFLEQLSPQWRSQ